MKIKAVNIKPEKTAEPNGCDVEKMDNGFCYVVEAVLESKKHRPETVSMYKN